MAPWTGLSRHLSEGSRIRSSALSSMVLPTAQRHWNRRNLTVKSEAGQASYIYSAET
jgi:hypothetical protein